MYSLFILINIIVLSFAVVGPWATITAFEAGRATGWLMTLTCVISHAYVWYALAHNSEILFCLGAPWGAYEFICSLAPLGVIEVEEEQAAATAANKG
ncbi:hypothetical protein EUA60_02515 [TM7 phylum sp. oral taxon 346]|jgi:hypothetical protein|nr:hypothetical protein EUA60_02515 [TM7 phylum sp. oral taxon 346]